MTNAINNELQSKLTEVLTAISTSVGQAKDFAVEQLPDVAQQYIHFGMVWETAAFVMLLVGGVVALGTAIVLTKRGVFDEFDTLPVVASLSGYLLGIIFLVFAAAQTKAVALVWFAPKLYLLQGIAQLIK